ncbi:hypothetical protein AtubIFM56815_003144 [Aspergillus tubingensis]|uniref:Uncharacterized protein n=1 Tax=Aspergillus tubingensis TaxID=5068 RepID=A0A8H3SSY0_ASPTU|nr:uncharacterized protein AtWU_05112 [Aspergillus tubingensis]GFN15311.1 hypothetical protein AtWU_05112 [Aspergillus tubingensis]GLA88683.1 hypothetical protein AtubIFM56815_003144 [Aspergillus tubingensis]GLA91847.1 hypothetical protein AtubIFM57143_006498 [Aspergillus tubingensis]
MASIMGTIITDKVIHKTPAIDNTIVETSTTDGSNLSDESESLPVDQSNPSTLWGILLADSSKPSDLSESTLADDSKLSDFSESILTDDSGPSDLSGSVLADDSSLSVLSESLTTDDTCYSHSHTHLETLPAEIRFQILSFMDYKGLKALVQASPIYLEQYLVDRDLLLFGCLEATLGSLLFEASVVHETGSLAFSEARTSNNILQFCQSLKERSSSSRFSNLTEDITREDASDMMAFHFDVIKPFAKHYAEWALSNLAKEPEASHTKVDEPLSESEEFRIIRALYRFQICCNLFGLGPHQDHVSGDYQDYLFVKTRKICQFLESLYHPWELEELWSINVFAEEKCTEFIKSIEWDFHEDNPRFDRQGRPCTPDGAIDIRTYDDCYMRGILTRGLRFLHKIMYEIQDHMEVVRIMENNLVMLWAEFLGGCHGALDITTRHDRRLDYPSAKDKREELRDPLPFRGDIVNNLDGEYPPLAWTILWEGTYSNMLGGEGVSYIAEWGYVMWDAARLERTGAKEVLARRWRERLRLSLGEDPREYNDRYLALR